MAADLTSCPIEEIILPSDLEERTNKQFDEMVRKGRIFYDHQTEPGEVCIENGFLVSCRRIVCAIVYVFALFAFSMPLFGSAHRNFILYIHALMTRLMIVGDFPR
jgi:hypothetical protein